MMRSDSTVIRSDSIVGTIPTYEAEDDDTTLIVSEEERAYLARRHEADIQAFLAEQDEPRRFIVPRPSTAYSNQTRDTEPLTTGENPASTAPTLQPKDEEAQHRPHSKSYDDKVLSRYSKRSRIITIAVAIGIFIVAVALGVTLGGSMSPQAPSAAPVAIFGRVEDPDATTSLVLAFEFLKGTVPTELGLFTRLTHLDLSFNTLVGSLPSEMGLLTQLEDLILWDNFLIGEMPSEMGMLTQLTYLDVQNNFFEGSIPSEIGELTRLQLADLSVNEFDGSIPTEFEKLTSLQYLSLFNTTVTGSIPSTFCSTGTVSLLISCGSVTCSCCQDEALSACQI